MADSSKSLAAELDRLIVEVGQLAERARQFDSEGSVVARILRGELLNLEQAADIAD